MIENLSFSGLLAGHNVALVLLAGGLFYLLKPWQLRLKQHVIINPEWDQALEAQTPWRLEWSCAW